MVKFYQEKLKVSEKIMFEKLQYSDSKIKNYEMVAEQLKCLIEDEENTVANLSNAAALLNIFLDEINWVGFYLMDDAKNELVLGPFQGLPACIRIPLNRGVCGTCASTLEIQRIADVHAFPGHIACDAATQSEIVLPIVKDGKLLGVLDIDSPIYDRFDADDEVGLKSFIDVLVENL